MSLSLTLAWLLTVSPPSEAGRDLWKSSCPTSMLKQGLQELVTQGHVQTALEYLQGWRLHSISAQPVLSYLHSKKVFPDHRII